MHKTRIRLYLCFNKLIRKNQIRFIHKTRIRLNLCFNKLIRKNQIRFIHKTRIRLNLCFNKLVRKKKRFMHKTRIRLYLCYNMCLYMFQYISIKRRGCTEHRTQGVYRGCTHRVVLISSCML